MMSSLLDSLSFNIERFYENNLNDTFSASRIIDLKIGEMAKIAVAGSVAVISLAALVYAKRCAIKKDPQMIQVFASNWKKINPNKRYIPMNGLLNENDCAHLRTIFQSCRLHREIRFFDLLGVQIYRNWKRTGLVGEEDLENFGGICKELSNALIASELLNKNTIRSTVKASRDALKRMRAQLSKVNIPELEIFLKVLSDPQKAEILGISAADLFEGSEDLEKGESSPADVEDFLEFATNMFPDFASLCHKGKKSRWEALENLIAEAKKQAGTKNPEVLSQHNLLISIQNLIERRELGLKAQLVAASFRLFANSQALHMEGFNFLSKGDRLWLQNQYKSCLGEKFFEEFKEWLDSLKHIPLGCITQTEIIDYSYSFSEKCHIRGSLSRLESIICKSLDEARGKVQDGKAYVQWFVLLVRLYQLTHDVKFIKDRAKKNRLKESLFPASMIARAFWHSAGSKEPPKENFQDSSSNASTAAHISSNVSFDEKHLSCEKEEETPVHPRLPKIKTRKEARPVMASSQSASSAIANPELDPGIDVERPSFPRHPTPQQLLKFLLDNGFIIERINGSHYQLKHAVTKTPTTVPYHGDGIGADTLHSIRRAFLQSQEQLYSIRP